jgi:biotin transporter BioY
MDSPNKEKDKLGYLIRFLILAWTAALLTASYMGKMEKMDPTFIASLLSGTLASYGIQRMKENGNGKKL